MKHNKWRTRIALYMIFLSTLFAWYKNIINIEGVMQLYILLIIAELITDFYCSWLDKNEVK